MSSIIKVNTVQDIDGNNIINESANTITIGASGDTITIPSGATLANNGTATGFGIAWQAVETGATLTAVAGNGYWVNTTAQACTVTLPAAASVGDQVQIVDYAGTFASNNITLTSSLNINGAADDKGLITNREGVTITYVDTTQGWVATSGVNSGSQALDPLPYSADFLVIAGGGSGESNSNGGGGGAGGYRTSTQNLTIGNTYTITVGDGGASVTGSNGNNGSNSSISGSGLTTITSTGGGYGGRPGGNGGSGGGAGNGQSGGTGNTPSTSPSQGNNGGDASGSGSPAYGASGGGGAGAVGADGTSAKGGDGGAGSASSITGSAVTRAGGGGGGTNTTIGTGGSGGGGDGSASGNGVAGTVNTGSGGGGCDTPVNSGAGGKGVVILSMPDANYSGTTTGSPTVATGVSGKTVLTFTGTGSYTG